MSQMQPLREGEIEQAIVSLNTLMDKLEEAVAAETAHVRAGRLRDALARDTEKTDLARRYTAESNRLRAASAVLGNAPRPAIEALRQRHAAFQSLLQTNMTVLATAHAVAEGIIRGVSSELARKRAPSTYGASGRANAPAPGASQPIAVCRTL